MRNVSKSGCRTKMDEREIVSASVVSRNLVYLSAVNPASRRPFMKTLLFINACMRTGSRTQRIADVVLAKLSGRYRVETIDLRDNTFSPVDNAVLEDRNEGIVPETHVELARKIATADRIVIAAPFWDMSFPAVLKVFFERTSLFGVTFHANERGCSGLCRAEKVLYITTRGMNIKTGEPLEQATPYIQALSHLWGLGDLTVVAAENLDYSTSEEVEIKIRQAINEGLRICDEF